MPAKRTRRRLLLDHVVRAFEPSGAPVSAKSPEKQSQIL